MGQQRLSNYNSKSWLNQLHYDLTYLIIIEPTNYWPIDKIILSMGVTMDL